MILLTATMLSAIALFPQGTAQPPAPCDVYLEYETVVDCLADNGPCALGPGEFITCLIGGTGQLATVMAAAAIDVEDQPLPLLPIPDAGLDFLLLASGPDVECRTNESGDWTYTYCDTTFGLHDLSALYLFYGTDTNGSNKAYTSHTSDSHGKWWYVNYIDGRPDPGCHDSGGKKWHANELQGGLSPDSSSGCESKYYFADGTWGSGAKYK